MPDWKERNTGKEDRLILLDFNETKAVRVDFNETKAVRLQTYAINDNQHTQYLTCIPEH